MTKQEFLKLSSNYATQEIAKRYIKNHDKIEYTEADLIALHRVYDQTLDYLSYRNNQGSYSDDRKPVSGCPGGYARTYDGYNENEWD